MATCDTNTLLESGKCFACLTPGQMDIIELQLLCEINAACGGSGTGLDAGMIVMWSGTIATIPSGFGLCDGTLGTPDLRNRFVVCANADSGGAAKTTITGAPLQSGGANTHTHTVSIVSGIPNSLVTVDSTIAANTDVGDQLHTHSVTGATLAGTAIPTFYALAYIMKL